MFYLFKRGSVMFISVITLLGNLYSVISEVCFIKTFLSELQFNQPNN